MTVAGAPVAFGGCVVVVGGAMLAGGTSPISAFADFGGRSLVHWQRAVPSLVLNEQSTTWPLGSVRGADTRWNQRTEDRHPVPRTRFRPCSGNC